MAFRKSVSNSFEMFVTHMRSAKRYLAAWCIFILTGLFLVAAPAQTDDTDSSIDNTISAGIDIAQHSDESEDTALQESSSPVDVIAQTAAKASHEMTLPIQMSLTTSGGVSLGAYQAGYLYYLVEVTKLNPDLFDPRIVTGSSAGTINSLISVISMGNELVSSPSESLFYQLWTDMSIQELLDVEDAPPLALSSRKAFEKLAKKMEAEWNEGLSEDLEVVVGATATRVKSRKVDVSGDFTVPRQEEKFVFRIQGRGKGKLPRVMNYVDKAHGTSQPLLPFMDPFKETSTVNNFDILKKLMFASSAFPLAFPAQEMSFCMTLPELDRSLDVATFRECVKPQYTELFVDGSMFDRNPLGLAYRIGIAGFEQVDGQSIWRDDPDSEKGELPENFYFLYLDALNVSYPAYKPEAVYHRIEALFPTFGSYSQGFVRSAQAKEIYTLLDHHPEVRSHIHLTQRNFPTASGLLANFFGFFEEKFRIFDFYLGMYDAHKYIKREVSRQLYRQTGKRVYIRYPENTESARKKESWNPYYCMRSKFDGIKRLSPMCIGEHLEDFRILLQVSLNRLYDLCSDLPLDETIDHQHCIRGMKGEFPPEVQPMVHGNFVESWHRQGDESRFQYTIRLLEQYNFWFEDLGLERDEAWLAMSRIREILAGALDDYAEKLPQAESIAIRVLGKPGLNFFKYQPPQVIIYVGAGKGAEFGLSAAGKYAPARWVRFNFGLQFKGLYELMGPEPNVFAMTPLIGMELEKTTWSSAVMQGRLGVRLGYQLSTGDSFTRGVCDLEQFSIDSRGCSAPVGQLFLALTFYERVRVQGGVEWFPYFLPPMSENDQNVFNGFLEIGWQWISPF
ncbi:MAG: patatin-like phospholipase family protein [Deltaproteobacteria bacterium]|nr:patatin-like phospholipase family protein [Deltaproteobacteria bacterium]